MGHHVSEFRYGTAVGEFYGSERHEERQRKNDDLIDQVNRALRHEGLDLIFCYVYDDFLTVSCAQELARFGIPKVNFNVDMTNQWYRQIRTAKYFDAILCAHQIHMEDMRRYGASPVYFPMAARVLLSSDPVNFVPAGPITFLGSSMPYREHLLSLLQEKGFPLAVYGRYWRENTHASAERSLEKTLHDAMYYAWPRLRSEGISSLVRVLSEHVRVKKNQTLRHRKLPMEILKDTLPDNALESFFRNSQINLGFTRMVGDDPFSPGLNQIKLRDFEVPAAGGFYLVERAPDYEELFVLGREVEVWSSVEELADKLRFYLPRPTDRRRIAEAGQRRALAEHTWAHRFQNLFRILGIDNPSHSWSPA
jgi:hypothetical protein